MIIFLRLFGVLLLLHGAFAYARVLGYPLTGNEILCEVIITTSCQYRPGIYAIAPESGEFECIIPFGRRPLWSPDHRYFAYWAEGEWWYVDVAQRRVHALGGEQYPIHSDDARIYWFPDGKSIVTRLKAGGITHTQLAARYSITNADDSTGLWPPKAGEQIGAMSFSTDGKRVAYERVSLIPGFGPVPSAISIHEVGKEAGIEITAPELEGKICLNPRWQPNGTLLAFDAVTLNATRQRDIYLWDTATNALSKYDLYAVPYMRKGNVNPRVLDWDPQGQALLIQLEHVLSGPEWGHLRIVPLDTTQPSELIPSGDGVLCGACWSPDGKRVAFIRCSSVDPWYKPNEIRMDIWDRGSTTAGKRVTFPEGAVPIYLDW